MVVCGAIVAPVVVDHIVRRAPINFAHPSTAIAHQCSTTRTRVSAHRRPSTSDQILANPRLADRRAGKGATSSSRKPSNKIVTTGGVTMSEAATCSVNSFDKSKDDESIAWRHLRVKLPASCYSCPITIKGVSTERGFSTCRGQTAGTTRAAECHVPSSINPAVEAENWHAGAAEQKLNLPDADAMHHPMGAPPSALNLDDPSHPDSEERLFPSAITTAEVHITHSLDRACALCGPTAYQETDPVIFPRVTRMGFVADLCSEFLRTGAGEFGMAPGWGSLLPTRGFSDGGSYDDYYCGDDCQAMDPSDDEQKDRLGADALSSSDYFLLPDEHVAEGRSKRQLPRPDAKGLQPSERRNRKRLRLAHTSDGGFEKAKNWNLTFIPAANASVPFGSVPVPDTIDGLFPFEQVTDIPSFEDNLGDLNSSWEEITPSDELSASCQSTLASCDNMNALNAPVLTAGHPPLEQLSDMPIFWDEAHEECENADGTKRYVCRCPLIPLDVDCRRTSDSRNLFIFDWDDTLLPTSWIRDTGLLSQTEPSPSQSRDVVFPSFHRRHLKKLEKDVIKTLKRAQQRGRVVVITNGDATWIPLSCQAFFPRLVPHLKKITCRSAKNEFSPHTVDPAGWKYLTFVDECRSFLDLPNASARWDTSPPLSAARGLQADSDPASEPSSLLDMATIKLTEELATGGSRIDLDPCDSDRGLRLSTVLDTVLSRSSGSTTATSSTLARASSDTSMSVQRSVVNRPHQARSIVSIGDSEFERVALLKLAHEWMPELNGSIAFRSVQLIRSDASVMRGQHKLLRRNIAGLVTCGARLTDVVVVEETHL